MEVAIGLYVSTRLGLLYQVKQLTLKLKYYYAVCLEYMNRKMGMQKAELDEESQFQLALHDELWGTAYIQGLYRW